jgi:hypothetical protein
MPKPRTKAEAENRGTRRGETKARDKPSNEGKSRKTKATADESRDTRQAEQRRYVTNRATKARDQTEQRKYKPKAKVYHNPSAEAQAENKDHELRAREVRRLRRLDADMIKQEQIRQPSVIL